jgi:hypothetical protein
MDHTIATTHPAFLFCVRRSTRLVSCYTPIPYIPLNPWPLLPNLSFRIPARFTTSIFTFLLLLQSIVSTTSRRNGVTIPKYLAWNKRAFFVFSCFVLSLFVLRITVVTLYPLYCRIGMTRKGIGTKGRESIFAHIYSHSHTYMFNVRIASQCLFLFSVCLVRFSLHRAHLSVCQSPHCSVCTA